eukprot:GILJ01008830.1.p1 GENE.GILJ01008830.1~~GILJ01008830.1.p1  ORF type:complete len:661 (+),score=124.09 GILJ01008830.1:165-1985(+)
MAKKLFSEAEGVGNRTSKVFKNFFNGRSSEKIIISQEKETTVTTTVVVSEVKEVAEVTKESAPNPRTPLARSPGPDKKEGNLWSRMFSGKKNVADVDKEPFMTRAGASIANGYPIPDLQPDDGKDIDHLIIIVHGIGATRERLADNLKGFRTTMEHVLHTRFTSIPIRTEIEMIDWKSSLLEKTKKQLSWVTLGTATFARSVLNQSVVDLLFYLDPSHSSLIIEEVVEQMNMKFQAIVSKYPKFSGKISLIGHSLGSVILYDILSHQISLADALEAELTGGSANANASYPQLSFAPQNLFIMGSPLPLFLTIRGAKMGPQNTELPTCRNLFNIFHPLDPVAYRMEPLRVEGELPVEGTFSTPPVVISHWRKGQKKQKKPTSATDIKKTVEQTKEAIKSKMNAWSQDMQRYLATKRNKKQTSSSALELEEKIHEPISSAVQDDLDSDSEPEQGSPDLSAINRPLVPPPGLSDTPEDDIFAGLVRDDLTANQLVLAQQEEAAGEETGLKLNADMVAVTEEYVDRYDFALLEKSADSIMSTLGVLTSHFVYWRSRDTMFFICRQLFGKKFEEVTAARKQEDSTSSSSKSTTTEQDTTPKTSSTLTSSRS